VVILTEWDEYRSLDLLKLADAMGGRILLDFRNVVSAEQAVAAGLQYRGLGRPPVLPRPAKRGQGAASVLRVAASPA
jgi:hypothetical protein